MKLGEFTREHGTSVLRHSQHSRNNWCKFAYTLVTTNLFTQRNCKPVALAIIFVLGFSLLTTSLSST